MAEQFAVTQIPGAETGEIPPSPVDRDEKTAFIYSLVDPVWDIDTLPLTYTNSRWSAFFYRADEKQLRRVLPDCLELEDDIVEFWYVDHNHTMLGPYGEMGVTVAASHKAGDGRTLYAGYYPYMYLTQDAAIDAGRVLGFPKKEAFIRVLEHGGAPDDGYGVIRRQELPVRLLLVPHDPERVRAPLGHRQVRRRRPLREAEVLRQHGLRPDEHEGRHRAGHLQVRVAAGVPALAGDQGPRDRHGPPRLRGFAPLPGQAGVDPHRQPGAASTGSCRPRRTTTSGTRCRPRR